jgi:DNA repair protein RadC
MIIRELQIKYGKKMSVGESVKSPETVNRFFRKLHAHEDIQEKFHVLCLDAKLNAVGWRTIAVGSVSEMHVHPRDIFQTAMMANASSIIMVHNHPSGEVSPSAEDINMTRRMIEAGTLLGIAILDHIIIGHDSYLSLKEGGYL